MSSGIVGAGSWFVWDLELAAEVDCDRLGGGALGAFTVVVVMLLALGRSVVESMLSSSILQSKIVNWNYILVLSWVGW